MAVPRVEGDRRVENDVRRREAVVNRRRIDEGLERRARLARGLDRPIEVRIVEVASAHERDDLPARWVEGHDRTLEVFGLVALARRRAAGFGRQHRARLLILISLLERGQAFLERLLRRMLDVDVDGGVYAKAAFVDLVRAIPLVQVLPDHLHEVRRLLGVVARLGHAERRLACLLVLRPVDEVGGEHLREHEVPATERSVGVAAGRVIAWISRKTREQGALRERQLLHSLPEIDLGRGVDAVGALPEVDLIEVHLEDFVLGVGLLDPDREHDLLELSREGLLVREEEVPRKLLGDGAAALLRPPRHDVGDEGPHEPNRVDSPVRVKAAVFDREDRLDERLRDIAERHDGAVLFEEFVHELLVPVEYQGLDRRRDRLKICRGGEVFAEPVRDPDTQPDHPAEHDDEHGEHEFRDMSPAWAHDRNLVEGTNVPDDVTLGNPPRWVKCQFALRALPFRAGPKLDRLPRR